jgi:hypothetical protein
MQYDWYFGQKSKSSDAEKRQCMNLVHDLINLSMMARRNGLLSLIQVAEETHSFLLKKGLQLIVDGVAPQLVRNVLESYIVSGDYEGKELLERCLVLEGVAAIQQGLHPKVTKELLLSFLGEYSYEIYQKEFESERKGSLKSYLKSIEDTTPSSSRGSKLDQIILKLSNDAIEKFLMEINTGDLAKSLKGMGGRAQIRIFNKLSKKAARALRDTIEDLNSLNASELATAQQMALEIISDLQ